MHELVDTVKWIGIALAWVGALGMSWALVRVGSTPKDYELGENVEPLRLPTRKSEPSLPRGQTAKVIPLRHG